MLVALVKGIIKDYEEVYWYIFGLHEQYRWRVEIMCPMTYEEAKDLALIVEAEIDDGSVDKKKSCDNQLDD
ncbi:33203_t:CDS:1, partial [Gigaspora margarita]